MTQPDRIVTPIVMAIIMSFVMSGIITSINLGLGPRFAADWMGAWKLSGPIAIVGVLLTRPVAERISALIIRRLMPRRAD